ncbi:MAG: CHAT domain-containing protein, partial [Bacteroidota bacterium]
MLIESHSINYELTLNDRIGTPRNRVGDRSSLLFIDKEDSGTPRSFVFDNQYLKAASGQALDGWPGIGDELAEVNDHIKSGFDILRGPDASKERILSLAPDYEIVHIASHGIPNLADPVYSSISISGSPTGDLWGPGLLTPLEVASRSWSTSLVVLSACGTAQGNDGNGPSGFVRAFRSAGVNCVIATLGDIDDVVTAKLVGEFYSAMSRGYAPVDALREAKLALLHQGVNPRKWAPFVAYGSTGPISSVPTRSSEKDWDRISWVSLAVYLCIVLSTIAGWKLRVKEGERSPADPT